MPSWHTFPEMNGMLEGFRMKVTVFTCILADGGCLRLLSEQGASSVHILPRPRRLGSQQMPGGNPLGAVPV